jgi:hypothetical protein
MADRFSKEVTRKVTLTSSLYEASEELFTNYPLAPEKANDGGTLQSMVLLLPDGEEASYFVLSQYRGDGRSWYRIRPWPDGAALTIDADADAIVPRMFARAVNQGTPLPRDGSLFGCIHDGAVNALVAVYTEHSPELLEPCWSVMPCAEAPGTQWPSFISEPFIGNWFWELMESGKIVSIEKLVAETPETVFWLDTEAALGSYCCVVTQDIKSPEGYILPRGRYLFHEVLQAGIQIPSADELLSSFNMADLAPRFY